MRLSIAYVVAPVFAFLALTGCDQHRATVASKQLQAFKSAIAEYQADFNEYPPDLHILTTKFYTPFGHPYGPYVLLAPIDPWGRPYVYHRPATKDGSLKLLSTGPDGKEGNRDDVRPAP